MLAKLRKPEPLVQDPGIVTLSSLVRGADVAPQHTRAKHHEPLPNPPDSPQLGGLLDLAQIVSNVKGESAARLLPPDAKLRVHRFEVFYRQPIWPLRQRILLSR